MLYTCPCCGYKTKSVEYYGSYQICVICFWEDDELQVDDPDMAGGANPISLRESQKNFKEFGACQKTMLENVLKDRSKYEKDLFWKPLKDQ